MSTPWNKDKIFFMFQRSPDTLASIYVNEPFLSATFQDHIPPQPVTQTAYRTHHFPKILALGIMMIEIELGSKIENYIEPDMLEVGKISMTTYHLAAIAAFHKGQLWKEKDTFCFVKESIETCLVPDAFKPFLNDVEGQRNELYRGIVDRLGNRYRDLWADPENPEVKPIDLDGAPRGRRHDLDTVDVPSLPHDGSWPKACHSVEKQMQGQAMVLLKGLFDLEFISANNSHSINTSEHPDTSAPAGGVLEFSEYVTSTSTT